MKLIRYIIIFIAFLLAMFLAYKAIAKVTGLPGFSELFSKNETSIENTPIIIREMKDIAQLLTQRYYDECIVDTIVGEKVKNINPLILMNPLTGFKGYYIENNKIVEIEKRYVLIANGLVKAGFNLKHMNKKNIQVFEDSISIQLPQPKITDVIINPSGFETFEESGIWTFNERKEVQQKANLKLQQSSLRKGILRKSKEQGQKILTQFFKSLGYKKVTITIQ